MIYRDMNYLVNAWVELMYDSEQTLGPLFLDTVKVEVETEGTKAHYIKKLVDLYHKAQDEASTKGYVGVGCITYAEQALVQYQENTQ